MENTCGALMYDDWTDTGIHYVAQYAVCVKTVLEHTVVRLTLLSVSQMGQKLFDADADGRDMEDTPKFNAETHLEFCAMCGENASTNLKIVRLSEKPNVRGNSHKLNLEKTRWFLLTLT